ncbi:MAG: hypothetical protein JSW51_12480 [Gemmatimonadota bacterium]|nr:MAG: hypothetical protein JSW51_12480 [Gemmatimonadota bacterium]
MVASLLAALLITSPQQQGDTTTFSNAATAELYARARVRHVRQDSLVRDYRALVHTRMDVTAGRSRFARQTALVAHETVAQITWRSPNDLKVQVRGARSAMPVFGMMAGISPELDEELEREGGEFRQEVWFDRPWFIPRSLGDSVRLMGVPDRAALHPLARTATEHYRFSITDSVRMSVPGREVRAVKMRVEPKELAPSLVAGDMWIDQETGDVVRLTVVFVGEYLWEEPSGNTPQDSADAREDNEWATRFLTVEADIEYSLVARQYWLPYRQLLAITARVPWFVNATIPARAVSTFSEYQVNTSPSVEFVVPLEEDSTGERTRTRERGRMDEERPSTRDERYRSGYYQAGRWSNGRWEVDVPPADSLVAYQWAEEFRVSLDADEQKRIQQSIAELADISEGLPPEWVGKRTFQMAWERFSDIVRFNRAQGFSLGAGFQFRPGPRFTTVLLTGRFAFGDLKPNLSAVWRRDGPGGRWDLSGYWDVHEVEPWTHGLGVGNSINAFFAGHDDAEYYRVLGGGVSYAWYTGPLRNFELGAYYEYQESMPTEVRAPIPNIFGDGEFPPNRPIVEGEYLRGSLTRSDELGLVELREGAEVLGNKDNVVARFWGSATVPFSLLRRTGAFVVRAGVLVGDSLAQMDFRLGGPQTVRGYTYGTRADRQFWSAQLDFALRRSAIWTPVLFADIGDTFSSDPLVGGGIGLSLLNGMMRLNLSKGFRPTSNVRFDLVFRAAR